MLIIIKRLSSVLCRPKYYPQSRHAQWCVYDTDKKITVYGPETRSVCQRFINEESTMSIDVKHESNTEQFPMIMENPKSKTVLFITSMKHTGAYAGFILADCTSNPSPMGRFSDHWSKTLVPRTTPIALFNSNTAATNKEYPLLMKNEVTGGVFLITEKRPNGMYVGFLLASAISESLITGKQSAKWAKSLVPYTGTLTLSNNLS